MRIELTPNINPQDGSTHSIQAQLIRENNDPEEPSLQIFTDLANSLRSRLLQRIRLHENQGRPLTTEDRIRGNHTISKSKDYYR